MSGLFKKFLTATIAFIFLLLVLLELFSYSGFVEKHLFIPLDIYIFISFVFVAASVLRFNMDFYNKLGMATFILAIFSLALMIFLSSIELSNYPNYIYSKFHLELRNFPLLVGYFLSLSAIFLYTRKLFSLKGKFFPIAFLFLICVFVFNETVVVAGTIRRYLPPVLAKPQASYTEKMYYLWDDPVGFFEIVDKIAPEGETVFVPPRSTAHEITGNPGFVRYFLHPRKIITYNPEVDMEGFLISTPGNETGNGVYKKWPDFDIEVEYYYLINPEKNTYKKINNNYESDVFDNNQWGLIKL